MSYLTGPRLVFSGRFQADVSTVNNDVRHFYNDGFVPEFQEVSTDSTKGWWNPNGSGAFRLVDCKIAQTVSATGTVYNSSSDDNAVGLYVANALNKTAGKMVDLDPQWQMASAICALSVRITDGTSPGVLLGDFQTTSFRDLGMRQATNPNGQPRGAAFISVLENLQWQMGQGFNSPVLAAIQEAAGNEGVLSIVLNTFGFYYDVTSPNYTFGGVVGAIGVQRPSEPKHFVLGRRFAPTKTPGSAPSLASNYFTVAVDTVNNVVSIDLGNAMPITDPAGTEIPSQGDLSLVVLDQPDTVVDGKAVYVDQGSIATGTLIGPIEYQTENWLNQTAGIVTLPLTPEIVKKMATHPLAILVAGDLVQSVLIRETLFGFDYRPDDFVLRLNPSATSTDSGTLDFYVTQYGVPQSGMTLAISQAGSISDQGGGSTTGPVENIPIPDIGVPESALTFPISTTTEIVTDTAGIAALTLTGANPGSPRLLPANLDPKGSIINPPYMDGQIYVVLYSLNSTELAAVPADVLQYQNQQYQMLDGIYVHVRDAYTAHEPITWYDDVLPIFQQSSNLYPVMSKRLVKLADYDDVAANRAIISLAFSLPDSDPNYMPVTRDMSPAKHDMILKWLNAKDADGKYTLLKGTPPEPSITATKIMAATPAAASPQPTELSDRSARLRRLSLAKSGGNPDA